MSVLLSASLPDYLSICLRFCLSVLLEGATGDAANSPSELEVPDGAGAAVAAAEGEGGPPTTRLVSGRTGGAIPTKVGKSGCVTISFNDFALKRFV